jgi:hypothetical protein
MATTEVIPIPASEVEEAGELTGDDYIFALQDGMFKRIAATLFRGDKGETGDGQYSFIVNSNAALAAWANKTAGNDYTSVLIKKGTWSSAKEVNLTAAGTKVVVGQSGSKLVFTSQYGLRYVNVPTSSEYWMLGVSVELSCNSQGFGFSSCTNLMNCTGSGTGITEGYGFFLCTNLTGCTGNGTGYGISYGFGFSNCTNLTGCTGKGTGSIDNYGYGFDSCTNLTSCTGTGGSLNGSEQMYGSGFCACTNLTSCTGNGCGAGSSTYGFFSCNNLTSCTGTGGRYGFYACDNLIGCIGTNGRYGFYACINLTSCTNNGDANSSIDFVECRRMHFCRGSFNSCYMHLSGIGYSVDDTPDGGWNSI